MTRSKSSQPPADLEIVFVPEGGCEVTRSPKVAFATVLGSCVATCIRAPDHGVGGMNHFLLPSDPHGGAGHERFGAAAMERLVNMVLAASGATSRRALEAKAFGGAAVVAGLSDIGGRNVRFVRDWLARDGVRLIAEDLGGAGGRKVLFHPATGKVWVRAVGGVDAQAVAAAEAGRVLRQEAPEEDVELFV